jgi:hypothetical protein
MLFNVLQGKYWCPKTEDIRMKSIVKPPLKEVILAKLMQVCTARNLNIAWIDETHSPDKVWLVHVIATLDPTNEIFREDCAPPFISKRLKDIETIVLPNELFEDLPKSTVEEQVEEADCDKLGPSHREGHQVQGDEEDP